jgi:hypothetical protein
MAMCIFPSIGGAAENQTVDNNVKIGLNDNNSGLEVNAASKTTVNAKKTTKRYKKTTMRYKKSTKKYRKVKVRYRYKGKWRYKWVNKSYNSVSAHSSYSSSSYRPSATTGSWSDDPVLDGIMRSGSGFGYRSGVSTAAAMQSVGAGDCWAMSQYLNGQFQAAGYQSRVIQYATSYSSQHRSVQVYRNGGWQTVPYRAYGYNSMFV